VLFFKLFAKALVEALARGALAMGLKNIHKILFDNVKYYCKFAMIFLLV
jgi:hypothetical protein